MFRRSPWPGKGKGENLVVDRFSSKQIPEEPEKMRAREVELIGAGQDADAAQRMG